jgi:hypothetical protein
MNSNDDYLWDKTGEPDPQIQQLEQILGTLRYQPRPLQITGPGFEVKRSFFRRNLPRLAIAATIAMLLFGLGIWFGLQRERPQAITASGTPQQKANTIAQSPPSTAPEVPAAPANDQNQGQADTSRNRQSHAPILATYRLRSERRKDQQIALKNLKEAQAAKDQLMLALRLTSAKLNFAQRKTQDLNQKDTVNNQHKIG